MTNAERDVKRLIAIEVERIRIGRREAIEHGHPRWSHAVAHGPCTKASKVER